jgi:hypothetical protein
VADIKVYYPPQLKIKQGFSHIRIIVRKFLFWQWLEMEGAQGATVLCE